MKTLEVEVLEPVEGQTRAMCLACLEKDWRIGTLETCIVDLRTQLESSDRRTAALEAALATANRKLAAAEEIAYKPPEKVRVPPIEQVRGDDGATQGPRPRGQQRGAPGHGRRRHPELPTVNVDLELPEGARQCKNCGELYVEIPGDVEAEVLEWQQVLRRVLYHRKRYGHVCKRTGKKDLMAAPPPPRPIRRGKLSAGFLAQLLVFKFALSLPLERTLLLLSYNSLSLSPGSVTGMFASVAELIAPLYAKYLLHHFKSGHWNVDETRWKVFTQEWDSPNGWMWAAVSEQVTVFIVDRHRSAEALKRLFPDDQDIHGMLQSDMFAVYTYNFLDKDRFVLAKCWVHVRRHIFRAARADDGLKVWAQHWLDRIREMYRLVRGRRYHPEDPALQAAIEVHMKKMQGTLAWQLRAPASPDALRVLHMMAWHWPELTVFVDHPEVRPDNNAGELPMRGPALARKNYQGSRAVWAANLSAMMFSIVFTLRQWKIDPVDYLTRYLDACAKAGSKAPQDLSPFLPWRAQADQGPAP